MARKSAHALWIEYRLNPRRPDATAAALAGVLASAALLIYLAGAAAQQPQAPLYRPGDAVVTGFSGALLPVQIAPGADPGQLTFINPQGPSLRIVDLQHMPGLAQAQLVSAPKPLTVSAATIGQVFGIALDDNTPPNIYAAATSAYGLPLVAPGPDGKPRHIQSGAPNASFMTGLWGPQGGPGSIWKIDRLTGAVTLFADVTNNGRLNSGAALGGIAYDAETKSLYVVDRESGLIHRFAPDGTDTGIYDHGTTGRAAQGLPPVPWKSTAPVNIADPTFDSTKPTSWNLAEPERRLFGLAVHQGRLYYAVADSLQIWSVGIDPGGSLGQHAVIELVAPPSNGPTEISKITFDEQGRMFLADRPTSTGAFDFEALAVPAIGRVLRYAGVGMADGRRVWQREPDEYAIGFPPDFRNGNGGVAIGYNYDRDGEFLPGSCGGFLWATGEDLRHAQDGALATRLAQSGPLDVNGLQGNGTWHTRVGAEPPLTSYFIDYDDQFDDPAERGHLGDVEIQRQCSPAQRAGVAFPPGGIPAPGIPMQNPPRPPPLPPGPPTPTPTPTPTPPPSPCEPGQARFAGTNTCGGCARPNIQIGGQCCAPGDFAAGGACSNSSCQPGQTPIGPSNFCCNSGQVYTGSNGAPACCAGPIINDQCQSVTPPGCQPGSGNPQCCPIGYVSTGKSCCLASQLTPSGICCPAGQRPSGPSKNQCTVLIPIPSGGQCCASGLIPAAGGQCCPAANVTTIGVCCAGPVDPKNRTHCPAQIQVLPKCADGYTKMPDGSCCNDRYVRDNGKSCNASQPARPLAPLVPLVPSTCPSGTIRDRDGDCIRQRASGCGPRQIRLPNGECGPPRPPGCAPGEIRLRNAECIPLGPPPCPLGMVRTPRGFCIPVGPRRFGPGGPPFGPRFGGPGRFGPPMGPGPGFFRR
jgi:hypothetical protein